MTTSERNPASNSASAQIEPKDDPSIPPGLSRTGPVWPLVAQVSLWVAWLVFLAAMVYQRVQSS